MSVKTVSCIKCQEADSVLVMDKGFKKMIRSLSLNHRYACKRCHITWRSREPRLVYNLIKTI